MNKKETPLAKTISLQTNHLMKHSFFGDNDVINISSILTKNLHIFLKIHILKLKDLIV